MEALCGLAAEMALRAATDGPLLPLHISASTKHNLVWMTVAPCFPHDNACLACASQRNVSGHLCSLEWGPSGRVGGLASCQRPVKAFSVKIPVKSAMELGGPGGEECVCVGGTLKESWCPHHQPRLLESSLSISAKSSLVWCWHTEVNQILPSTGFLTFVGGGSWGFFFPAKADRAK